MAVAAVLAVKQDWRWTRGLLGNRRQLLQVTAAAILIAINWLVYVWAVEQDRVIEASLGYFINPLVTVALGVVILGEHLSRLQRFAVALGALSVIIVTIAYGAIPYVSLTLAFSFAGYGFIKKTVHLGPLHSLTAETAILTPFALVVLTWMGLHGSLEFGKSPRLTVLLLAAGVVTAFPLLLFAAAARRIPLTLLGLLQYLTPAMQFVLAILVFKEHMDTSRWIGFGIVWMALAVLSADAIHRIRAARA